MFEWFRHVISLTFQKLAGIGVFRYRGQPLTQREFRRYSLGGRREFVLYRLPHTLCYPDDGKT